MDSELILSGRSIIVTGASRGLGREMALALLEAGAKVVGVSLGAGPQMDETIRRARILGAEGRFFPIYADLRSPSECERVADSALGSLGSLDALVNNAAVQLSGHLSDFWRIKAEDWLRTVDTNANAVFFLSKAVTPFFLGRKYGKIINISSGDRTMTRTNASPYGPSKAFVEAASRIWADELKEHGVTVNVLLPGGAVDTLADIRGKPAEGRTFLPASVMRAPIVWCASALSDAYTGQRIAANQWDESLPLPDRILRAMAAGPFSNAFAP